MIYQSSPPNSTSRRFLSYFLLTISYILFSSFAFLGSLNRVLFSGFFQGFLATFYLAIKTTISGLLGNYDLDSHFCSFVLALIVFN